MSEGRPATPPTNPQTRSPVQNTHTHRQTGRVRGEASDTAYQPGDSEPCPKHTDTDKQAVSEGRPATPPTNPETLSPVQNTQTNRPCQRGGQRHRLPTRRLGALSKTHKRTDRVRGEASDTAYQPGDSEPCPKHTDKQAVSEGRPVTPPTNPETRSPVQNTHTHRQTDRVRGEASDTAYQPGDSEPCPKHTHRQTGRVRGEASDTAYQPGDSEPCPKHTHTDKQAVSEGRPATPPTNPETRSPVQNTHTQTNRPCQRGGQRHRLPTRRL